MLTTCFPRTGDRSDRHCKGRFRWRSVIMCVSVALCFLLSFSSDTTMPAEMICQSHANDVAYGPSFELTSTVDAFLIELYMFGRTVQQRFDESFAFGARRTRILRADRGRVEAHSVGHQTGQQAQDGKHWGPSYKTELHLKYISRCVFMCGRSVYKQYAHLATRFIYER